MSETIGNGTEKKKCIPMLVMLVGAILLLLTLVLPYASATDDYKEVLEEMEDEIMLKEADLNGKDMMNMSLAEYAKVYMAALKEGVQTDISMSCLILIGGFALFGVLGLIGTIGKKQKTSIVFAVLAIGMFKLINFDFSDRRVVPSKNYDLGIAGYLGYIGGVVLLAGAIWLLIEKRKERS